MRTGAWSPKSTVETPVKVVENVHMPPAVSGRGGTTCPPVHPMGGPSNSVCKSSEPALAVGPSHPLLHGQAPSLSHLRFPGQPQQMGINWVATNLLRRPKSLIAVSVALVPNGSLRGALTQASPQRLEGLAVLGVWVC